MVWLESTDARAKVKPLPQAEIAQADKQFVPAVSVVTVGTPVSFPNRDTVRHHVYSFSDTRRFEIKLYVGTPEAPVVFDKPGIAVLGCNIHDQMAAWVVIVETPWYGRTDAQGNYRFWSIKPTYYPVPDDGPVGDMLRAMGRHPNRPGHIHMMVYRDGYVPVTTHLFAADSPYLDSDAVFGVRDSLIVPYERHAGGSAPDAMTWSRHSGRSRESK